MTAAQAHTTADTWQGVWADAADGALAVHGGKLVPLPGVEPPLDPAGVPPLTYSERDAMTAAWQRAVDGLGELPQGPSGDADRWPAVQRALAWSPPPAGPHKKDGDLLPAAELAAWWGSTARLALDLDAAGAPVTPFGVVYDLPTTPPPAPHLHPPAPTAPSSVSVREPSVWPTIAVVALAGLVVFAVVKRRRRKRRR